MNKFVLLKIILILLIIIIPILYYNSLIDKDNFSNNEYKNIFKTNIFDDKVIFLIANNPKITNETIDFLDKYDYDSENTLVVRFRNDPFKLIKKVCKNRTDMMIYRAALKYTKNYKFIGYHGFKKDNKHIKYNVFTYTKKNIDKKLFSLKSFDFIKNINNIKIIKKLKKLQYDKYMFFTDWFNNKEHTTGFSTLKNIIENTKFKKIYLVGYTNLKNEFQKNNNKWHNVTKEYNYFKVTDKNNK